MTLGTRVAVMRDGKIVQVAEPQVLYTSPTDLFVAAFIGSPAMNLVEATIDGDELRFGGHAVALDDRRRPAGDVARTIVGVRPEAFEDGQFAPPELPRLDVEIEVVEELGADTHVFFRVDAPRVTPDTGHVEEDDATLLAEERVLFTARVDPRTRIRAGSSAVLAVDPRRLHFFDPATGQAAELRGAVAPAVSVTA